MVDAVSETEIVHHASFGPGEFPAEWLADAYDLHCDAWPKAWEGQLSRERFTAELASVHVDVLHEPNGAGHGRLLAYVKWKATKKFYRSRDELADPSEVSCSSAPPAAYVCAYEITATPSGAWRGLGRRLLSEALTGWQTTHAGAVFCTYSPKRKLTAALRRLADTEQYGRPALEAFAHRAGAAVSRHVEQWNRRLGGSLEQFIREQIIPTPDQRITEHLADLRAQFGRDVIDGVVAALGIAYNFVLRASSGLPACGPAAFHRALGAEHWRQYPASANNCADALGLVDHWRYSHDPDRREKCARMFKRYCAARAQRAASPDALIALG